MKTCKLDQSLKVDQSHSNSNMTCSKLSLLPSTILLRGILPFLSVKDAVRFDSAVLDKSCRVEMCQQITNYVNDQFNNKSIELKALGWLVMRGALITNLRYNDIWKPQSTRKLVELLNQIKHNIINLSLKIDNFGSSNIQDVTSNFPTFPNLSTLELYGLNSHVVNLDSIWSRHQALKRINLYGYLDKPIQINNYCANVIDFELHSIIYDSDIDALATYCPLLQRVVLTTSNEMFTNSHVQLLSTQTLVKLVTNCKHIIELGLCSFTQFDDSTITSFIPHSPTLKHLKLTGCEDISDISINAIVKYCHTLQSIDITWCPLVTKAGYVHLKTKPTLTTIGMLDLGRTRHIIDLRSDETGFANLLEVVEEANTYLPFWGDDDGNGGHNYDDYSEDDSDDYSDAYYSYND